MPQLVVLGTSNAIPSPGSENTHLAVHRKSGIVLVDCPGNPIIRLEQAGLDPLRVDQLLLTHFHPDHVSGAPTFLMQSWLMGRKAPLNIFGLAYTIERIEKMMDLFEWKKWPGFFPLYFHTLPEQELYPFFMDDEIRLFTSPVHHLIPTVGLRCEIIASNQILAYSCDTQPCQEVVRLAENADILLHEASGESLGHTSAFQAGQIAAQANAHQLVLIHYPTKGIAYPGDFSRAGKTGFSRSSFTGKRSDEMEFLATSLEQRAAILHYH